MKEEFIQAQKAFEEAHKNFNQANYNLSLAVTLEEKKEAQKELSKALEDFDNAYKQYIVAKNASFIKEE